MRFRSLSVKLLLFREAVAQTNTSSSTPTAGIVTTAVLEAAYQQLQTWYHTSSGLWVPSTGWWNSANCMTVIADLAAVDSSVASEAAGVFANTYVAAQVYNAETTASKAVGVQWLPVSHYVFRGASRLTRRYTGFLNGYYDDEGWWALGWIAAYDLTGEAQYLAEAKTIFADMRGAFGQTPCSTNAGGTGGIWWDRAHTYVNAIANELFLSVAAHLATRTAGGEAAGYLAVAEQQWAWFRGSGMINAGDTINDGLSQPSCANNGGTVWSYNQGVILGGLVELAAATANESYVLTAQGIADAAIAALAPNGILHDVCEPDCGADGTQFKGIFARNLQRLALASSGSVRQRYASFLQTNAASILQNDVQGNTYSVIWSGPFVPPGNASTQSSAMDALVGAYALTSWSSSSVER